jgi:hypothetical protein
MMPPNRTEPMKPGAKLDPKGTALIKKIKELSKKTQAEFGAEHVGHLRIMPKARPPGNNCSCGCACS